MTLYEIDQGIMDLVNEETGEVKDFGEFMALQMARNEKIENTILYLKNLMAEAQAIKAEIDTLTARKRKAENAAARLKEMIETTLAGEEFSTPRCKVSYRKSRALRVYNEEALGRWLTATGYKDAVKSKVTVSKDEVNKIIKGGVDVPFVEVEEKRSMSIK